MCGWNNCIVSEKYHIGYVSRACGVPFVFCAVMARTCQILEQERRILSVSPWWRRKRWGRKIVRRDLSRYDFAETKLWRTNKSSQSLGQPARREMDLIALNEATTDSYKSTIPAFGHANR